MPFSLRKRPAAAGAEEEPLMKRPAAAVDEEEPAEDVAEEEQGPAAADEEEPVLKRPAADVAKEEPASDEAEALVLKRPAAAVAEEEPEQQEEPSEASKDSKAAAKEEARIEKEIVEARRKELKSMPVDELKRLLEAQGLETGKKEDMAERLAKHEAKGRADARAHQAKVRQVVVDKKDELEAMSITELKDKCVEEGIKGNLAKPARIEALISQWQEDDGVDKALAKIAHDAREQEFSAMDEATLQKLCEKVGVDPFVKEVVVDRIVSRESAAGRFNKPVLESQKKETVVAAAGGGDMVEALMASEASRKKAREEQKQEEEAAAKKKVALNALSVTELKKQLAAKGKEAAGKKGKDELVEALLLATAQEEVAKKRKAELNTMEPTKLKNMLKSKALPVGTKKDEMVDTLMAYEAEVCKIALAYSEKMDAVLAERKAAWEDKSVAELKELCTSQGVTPGVNKEVCRERLLEAYKASGEVDKILVAKARSERVAELTKQSAEQVLKVCAALALNPLVKEVMVERLLAYEEEYGPIQGPKAKRARKSM